MRVLSLVAPGQLRIEELQTPDGSIGEPLVRVAYAGICGSDIQKIYAAQLPNGYLKTQTLGHEVSGVITSGHRMGESVVLLPFFGCGSCTFCEEGLQALCPKVQAIGRDLPGGFGEFLTAPSSCLRSIPAGLDTRVATLSDPLAVGLHCCRAAGIGTETHRNGGAIAAAVIGDGVIAACLIIMLGIYGVKDIAVFGPRRPNINLLSSLNSSTRAVTVGLDPVPTERFDVVFEAVGRKQSETLDLGVSLLKPRGVLVMSGVFEQGFSPALPIRTVGYRELKIVGVNSFVVHKNGNDDFTRALEILTEHHKCFNRLITHEFPLEAFEAALMMLKRKDSEPVLKILLRPEF